MQTVLPIPNPHDWCDARQATQVLGVSRTTLYAMVSDGRITDYTIGTLRVFWRPELDEVAAAYARTRPPR